MNAKELEIKILSNTNSFKEFLNENYGYTNPPINGETVDVVDGDSGLEDYITITIENDPECVDLFFVSLVADSDTKEYTWEGVVIHVEHFYDSMD